MTAHQRENTTTTTNLKEIKESTKGLIKRDKIKTNMITNYKTVEENLSFAGFPPGVADHTHPSRTPKQRLRRDDCGSGEKGEDETR